MSEPVFVIHGVATHNEADFNKTVEALSQKLGGPWQLIPVFWGDLGGKADAINDTFPNMDALSTGVRSDDAGTAPPAS